MERFEHGGRGRDYPGTVDFSASLNPLGMPESVRAALHAAADASEAYPDPACRDFVAAIAHAEGVPAEWAVPCAGATDAITRVCLALNPHRALVCAPCYAGYEQALVQVGARVERHFLDEGRGFAVTATLLSALEGCDALFIANPNNPTGRAVDPALLERIMERAHAQGCAIVIDESFLGFTDQPSAVGMLPRFPYAVAVKSLTKLYAMAGVRAGYLLCADAALAQACRDAGQPWAVSTAAQIAGAAALREEGFAERSREYVGGQRAWLAARLRDMGLAVVPSEANFLLFKAPQPLFAPLPERGILVRPCGNFAGLDDAWHRVAVRTEDENRLLVRALEEVLA